MTWVLGRSEDCYFSVEYCDKVVAVVYYRVAGSAEPYGVPKNERVVSQGIRDVYLGISPDQVFNIIG